MQDALESARGLHIPRDELHAMLDILYDDFKNS